MEVLISKLVGWLVSPAKWLYQLWGDQTRIRILKRQFEDSTNEIFAVKDDGNGSGLLLFSVTTDSKKPVEITRIDVDYAAPLQLLDPGDRGFFVSSGALNSELPFRMSWNGNETVRSDLQQGFALTARFPPSVTEQHIRISVHANRQRASVGGFIAQGRLRVTTMEYRVRLTSGPVLDLALPPGCSFTSPQPYLIESALHVSGGPGSVAVHEVKRGGAVSSVRIDLPED